MHNQTLRVAIIDDEESIRRALLRLLASADYLAEGFDSAVRFLESLSRWTPDCVILDLQMPEITGIEVQQRLLELAQPPAVIVITAYDEPGTRELCLALGATYYFCKPVDGNLLLDSIAKLARGDRAPRPLR